MSYRCWWDGGVRIFFANGLDPTDDVEDHIWTNNNERENILIRTVVIFNKTMKEKKIQKIVSRFNIK